MKTAPGDLCISVSPRDRRRTTGTPAARPARGARSSRLSSGVREGGPISVRPRRGGAVGASAEDLHSCVASIGADAEQPDQRAPGGWCSVRHAGRAPWCSARREHRQARPGSPDLHHGKYHYTGLPRTRPCGLRSRIRKAKHAGPKRHDSATVRHPTIASRRRVDGHHPEKSGAPLSTSDPRCSEIT